MLCSLRGLANPYKVQLVCAWEYNFKGESTLQQHRARYPMTMAILQVLKDLKIEYTIPAVGVSVKAHAAAARAAAMAGAQPQHPGGAGSPAAGNVAVVPYDYI